MTLSQAANGIAGYDIEVTVSEPAVATIAGVTVADEFLDFGSGDVQTSGVKFRILGVDVDDRVQRGATEIVLAHLHLRTIDEGMTNIDLNVGRLDDDSDVPMEVEAVSGTLTVIGENCPTVQGLPDRARGLDADGHCEDVNGNGRLDFNDIITFFQQMDDQEIQNNADSFDFNSNGLIGMSDVVSLFEIMVFKHMPAPAGVAGGN